MGTGAQQPPLSLTLGDKGVVYVGDLVEIRVDRKAGHSGSPPNHGSGFRTEIREVYAIDTELRMLGVSRPQRTNDAQDGDCRAVAGRSVLRVWNQGTHLLQCETKRISGERFAYDMGVAVGLGDKL